jgi:hypothetical protein
MGACTSGNESGIMGRVLERDQTFKQYLENGFYPVNTPKNNLYVK